MYRAHPSGGRGGAEHRRWRSDREPAPIVVAAELSDRMLQGVVSVPHGFGRSGPSASVNDVTAEGQIDALSGVICFSGVPVSVTRHADVMTR